MLEEARTGHLRGRGIPQDLEMQQLEARSKFADSSSSPMMLFSPLPQPQLVFACKKSLVLQSELLEDPDGLEGAGGQLSKPGSSDR